MPSVEIKNGSLDVIASGSVIVQDITESIDLRLVLTEKTDIKFRIKFEVADTIKDASVKTMLDIEDDVTGLVLRIPKNHSSLQVVDTPLVTIGKNGKVYLAIGWSMTKHGDVRFEYTFSATKNLLRESAKDAEDK